MTDVRADFLSEDGQLFGCIGEVLSAYVRRRFPGNTAKRVAQAWDLDVTTATNLTKGHASERTITKALRAEGWPLVMALGEAVTGDTYEDHLHHIIEEHARAKERMERRRATVRDLEARASRFADLDAGLGA